VSTGIGDWDPMWLGQEPRRLYAALHAAPGTLTTGVVLVPPLLHEQPRSRRFIAEVASELASLGLPCLRFDFHGTGDSTGMGDELDFASMHRDLDLAAATLRQATGVGRIVMLAWRASALALQGWLERGGAADLAVLWEPVIDGESWLRELVEGDAQERALRPPPRPGVPRATDPADGQLMGFPASERLRSDLARARMAAGRQGDAPVWLVVRSDPAELPLDIARVLALPATAPVFDLGAAMDATFFLTPQVRDVVAQLGQAVRQEAWA
jgi:hypothetical protein